MITVANVRMISLREVVSGSWGVKFCLPWGWSKLASTCICLISIPTMVVLQTFSIPNLLWSPMWLKAHSQLAEFATTLRMWIANLVRWLQPVSSWVSIPSHISTEFTSCPYLCYEFFLLLQCAQHAFTYPFSFMIYMHLPQGWHVFFPYYYHTFYLMFYMCSPQGQHILLSI